MGSGTLCHVEVTADGQKEWQSCNHETVREVKEGKESFGRAE